MRLERAMKNNIALANHPSSGVAAFEVATGKHDCRISIGMTVARVVPCFERLFGSSPGAVESIG